MTNEKNFTHCNFRKINFGFTVLFYLTIDKMNENNFKIIINVDMSVIDLPSNVSVKDIFFFYLICQSKFFIKRIRLV